MSDKMTRRLEFDAGHRIPSHASKCRNIHGHRYVIEVTVRGPIKPVRGETDDGMIVDFGELKTIMNRVVVDPWDHAFLVYMGDAQMLNALAALDDNHKTVILDVVPTVENLARVAFDLLAHEIDRNGLAFGLSRVRLYETPNCWADAKVQN